MKKLFTLFAIFALSQVTLQGQAEYLVLLHSGNQFWKENARTYSQEAFISSQEAIDGNYYRLLQFYELPNQNQLDALSNSGVELLEYIPNKVYVAAIPDFFDVSKLTDFNVRTIMPIVPDTKMSVHLKAKELPEWAVKRGQAELMLKYYKNLRHEDILQYCLHDGIKVLQENGVNNFLRIAIPQDRIEEIASLPYVSFLEPVPPPGEPEDTEGRSLHRANTLDTQFPSGRKYRGDGVGVLCRDDGDVGPHIDFHGRLNSDYVGGFGGSHGDGVSGILAGAGNLNPRYRGMAAGADLYVTNYDATFLDETMMLFFDHNVIVTNSSYGDGCNDGYLQSTETVDQQVYENPTLLHVFSCGNSGGSNCGYGAGSGWGNITGGHKQGKNVIATANLYNTGVLVNSSSRGPAFDGRIKPDIAANGQDHISTEPDNEYEGFGGTSGASPNIVGISAMLHQAHRELNNGETAESGLIKGTILNTANDLGNPGPDFQFGWGHINAYRAALTIEENRFFKATVMPGDTNVHTITIPEGVVQARIMTYWMEPPATVMTTKALINDLDTRMIDTSGNEYRPWVLDPTPDPVNLSTPAIKGEDHLNNMEQISLENPTAGEYTLEVAGFELPFGEHEYYVIWEFRTADLTLVYPFGGEHLVPGEVERINWDAEGVNDPFQLYYSIDGGDNWLFIEEIIGTQRQYNWTVPQSLTGNGLFRIQRDTLFDVSDAPFNIAPVPNNLTIVKVCPDYVTLAWDPLAEATSYDVYKLGQKYMEVAANTTSTIFDLPIDNPQDVNAFAVSMREDLLGIEGQRTIALLYSGWLMNCPIDNEVGVVEINEPSVLRGIYCSEFDESLTISVTNTGLLDQDTVHVGFQLNNQTPVVEMLSQPLLSGQTVQHTFSENMKSSVNGVQTLKTWINVANDPAPINDTIITDLNIQVFSGDGEPIVYQEDFEASTDLPPFYSIVNPDNSQTWNPIQTVGITGATTNCYWLNNFQYAGTQNELDYLGTTPIDLTQAPHAILSFDIAYTYYSDGFVDEFSVEVSTNCGESYTTIFDKTGYELATVPSQTSAFNPETGDQWRTEKADLSPFIGNTVIVRFVNHSNYGNNIYLDNINVDFLSPPTANFTTDGTEFCQGEEIIMNNLSTGDVMTFDWKFGPSAVPTVSNEKDPLVTFNEPGMHTITLTTSNGAGSEDHSLDINILPLPTPSFDYDISGGTVTFTNTSSDANNYTWNFGDNNVSNEPSPTHIYSAINTYTVTLIAINDCGSTSTTQTVDITVGLDELNENVQVQILPNPADDYFDLLMVSSTSENLEIELLDLRGVILERENLRLNQNGMTRKFDVSEFASGIYFLKIQGEEGVLTKKIIIE